MLHNTLSALLESFASQYAQLSPSDVSIGISGGRLVVDDVTLRVDTFNSLYLPFHVQHGRCGRLRVNVPWSALSHTPVEIYLENVHLIAAPKPSLPPSNHTPSNSNHEKADWHQTMVGRLAFNVTVEMYGIKLEYRDTDCVAVLSVAEITAFSAGPDWRQRFVSLVEDSSHIGDEATSAVAMRKLVKLKGVHCVMIPRAEDNSEYNQHETPPLDRSAFESKRAIVDGIGINVRVLLCSGKLHGPHYQQHSTDGLTGLHAEIDVDLEEPYLSLTSRQITWIQRLLKQGLRSAANLTTTYANHPGSTTKRRPRPVPPEIGPYVNPTSTPHLNDERSPLLRHSESSTQHENPTEYDSTTSTDPNFVNDGYRDEDIDAEIDKLSTYEHEQGETDQSDWEEHQTVGVSFSSLWRAIVSENGDETVDDAAIALGLTTAYQNEQPTVPGEVHLEEEQADYLYARNAVEAAANAGGFTLQVRLKTPDLKAWDVVEKLQEELRDEKEKRARLQNLESILEKAEERVKASEEEARLLRVRNAALVQELGDLERMASQAGKNKDAMIRQMEGALARAEQSLQTVYQEEFNRQTPNANSTSPNLSGAVTSANAFANDSGITTSVASNREVPYDVTLKDDGNNVDHHEPARVDTFQHSIVREDNSGVVSQDGSDISIRPNKAPESDNIATHEVQSAKETLSPNLISELVQSGQIEKQYCAKINIQNLEEAISSNGLTLI